jgi:hypothetical protein
LSGNEREQAIREGAYFIWEREGRPHRRDIDHWLRAERGLALQEACLWYDLRYDVLESWFLRPGDKVLLGNKLNQACSFCGKTSPEVTFELEAHAIPEALGNKSITSTYECDACNQFFGRGIENDLGNWSKPLRTFARIRGSRGVPTLKKGGPDQGWRIEFGITGFNIRHYEDDPICTVDETKKQVRFVLKRDSYTPVAVLKAFVKIGLSLMPAREIANFGHAIAWIRTLDHSLVFAERSTVIYTFQPGPMPNDLITAFILRRKPSAKDVPYAFLVIGYGNEVFQVHIPSREHDITLNDRTVSLIPFPVPGSPDPSRYGRPGLRLLDLTGREVVRGDSVPITIGYEYAT